MDTLCSSTASPRLELRGREWHQKQLGMRTLMNYVSLYFSYYFFFSFIFISFDLRRHRGATEPVVSYWSCVCCMHVHPPSIRCNLLCWWWVRRASSSRMPLLLSSTSLLFCSSLLPTLSSHPILSGQLHWASLARWHLLQLNEGRCWTLECHFVNRRITNIPPSFSSLPILFLCFYSVCFYCEIHLLWLNTWRTSMPSRSAPLPSTEATTSPSSSHMLIGYATFFFYIFYSYLLCIFSFVIYCFVVFLMILYQGRVPRPPSLVPHHRTTRHSAGLRLPAHPLHHHAARHHADHAAVRRRLARRSNVPHRAGARAVLRAHGCLRCAWPCVACADAPRGWPACDWDCSGDWGVPSCCLLEKIWIHK